MSASCCNQPDDTHRGDEGYRRVLWAVLIVSPVEGREHGPVRLVGDRCHCVAHLARHSARSLHHGGRGHGRAYRQRDLVRPALGLSQRRLQYALGLDLHAQRRARQSRGAACVFGTGTGWPDVAVAAIMARSRCKVRSWSSISPGLNLRPQVCFNLQSSYAASRARPRST